MRRGRRLDVHDFTLGRQTADDWIAQNGDALGQRSTMDVQQLLPGSIWDYI